MSNNIERTQKSVTEVVENGMASARESRSVYMLAWTRGYVGMAYVTGYLDHTKYIKYIDELHELAQKIDKNVYLN